MSYKLVDLRCPECGYKINDYLQSTGEVVTCPEVNKHKVLPAMVVQSGAVKRVWPPYFSPGSRR